VRIKGTVFKKRTYPKHHYKKMDHLSFLEVKDNISFDGDVLKIIPVLSQKSMECWNIGDEIDVEGEMKYIRIITSLGKLSLLPVPVFIVKTIKEIKPSPITS
jgi:hypothetical protein